MAEDEGTELDTTGELDAALLLIYGVELDNAAIDEDGAVDDETAVVGMPDGEGQLATGTWSKPVRSTWNV